MKKKFKFLFFVILILIAVFFAFPFAMDMIDKPMSKDSSPVTVTITDGTSTLGIGKVLKDNGLIRNEFAFLIKVKTSEYNGKLAGGSFSLSPSMTGEEIIKRLSRQKPLMEIVTVTFPEGYSIEQMASALEENGVVRSEEFLKAIGEEYDFEFLRYIPGGEYKYALQGFLFPSTYEFYKNSKPR